jgi:hypothetical protein
MKKGHLQQGGQSRNDRDRNDSDIQILTLRRQGFLDVVGDRTPNEYYPSDLQIFVNRMQ